MKGQVGLTEAQRQRAIVALRDRYAADAMSLEEFGAQLDRVLSAATSDELPALVQDSGVGGDRTAWHGQLDAAAAKVTRHLHPGEELLWVGRPDPSKHLTTADRILIPFSVMWAGFAVFWEAAADVGNAPVMFSLFGAAFILLGLYVVFGRFIYKAYRKRRTIYAVTNRRVLAASESKSHETVESLYVRSIPSVSTSVRPDGSGSVIYANTPALFAIYLNSGLEPFSRSNLATGVNFFDIADAGAVGHLVDSLAAHGIN